MNAMAGHSLEAPSSSQLEPNASLATLLAGVQAKPDGLGESEAAERLRRFGRNELRPPQLSLPLKVALAQLSSPFVLVLLAAAGLSILVGEPDEATVIIGIVAVGAILGFVQEFRAAQTVAALSSRLAGRTQVRRAGAMVTCDPADLVPGDIVVLTGGSLVPADGVLLSANSLHVDEAALTGESFPVAKISAPPDGPVSPAAHVFMGTSVRSGSGDMLVLATGGSTQYGHIALAAAATEPETAFARGLRRFGTIMLRMMIVIILVVLPVNLLFGRPILDSVLFAAALAVGLTPELLPAIVTVTLARGARQLAGLGVLVKRLVAIENLGAMDVLCTDKTGTLTEGQLVFAGARGSDGAEATVPRDLATLNACLQSGLANPLDDALVASRAEAVSQTRKLGELPYDFERKRLSVLVDEGESACLVTKGAVSAVLEVSSTERTTGGTVPLTPDRRAALDGLLAGWSGEGFRVIAVATRAFPKGHKVGFADEADLVFEGFVLFADPVKDGVSATVAQLAAKGIRLKLVSGDNRHAARHVAAAVGLHADSLISGPDLVRLSPRALQRAAMRHQVFAEVTPDLKEALVAALRRGGHVVGFLGDGINDAPALRAADLGISVDSAVDAAREAADVVLLKRDLGVLLDGVLAGRRSFANTLKYIAMTTSANLGNMISMALASLVLPFLPLLAKQILVNNFLSDLPLLAVSTDRVDAEVLARPGQWNFRALVRGMIGFGLVSSLFDALTMGTLFLLHEGAPEPFRTGWFLESLLTEVVIVFVMRTRGPFWKSRPASLLLLLSLGVAAAAVVLPWLPIAGPLGFVALSPATLAILAVIVLGYAAATEVLKARIAR